MLFIEIDPKEKYYSVSPSFGCFSREQLKFIEETLWSFYRIIEEELWEVEDE